MAKKKKKVGRKEIYTKMLILIVWEIGSESICPTFLYLIPDFPYEWCLIKKKKKMERDEEREIRDITVEDGLERIKEKCLINRKLLEVVLWIDIESNLM